MVWSEDVDREADELGMAQRTCFLNERPEPVGALHDVQRGIDTPMGGCCSGRYIACIVIEADDISDRARVVVARGVVDVSLRAFEELGDRLEDGLVVGEAVFRLAALDDGDMHGVSLRIQGLPFFDMS